MIEEAGSGASEWENREREEQHIAQMAEEEARLGGGSRRSIGFSFVWGGSSPLQASQGG